MKKKVSVKVTVLNESFYIFRTNLKGRGFTVARVDDFVSPGALMDHHRAFGANGHFGNFGHINFHACILTEDEDIWSRAFGEDLSTHILKRETVIV